MVIGGSGKKYRPGHNPNQKRSDGTRHRFTPVNELVASNNIRLKRENSSSSSGSDSDDSSSSSSSSSGNGKNVNRGKNDVVLSKRMEAMRLKRGVTSNKAQPVPSSSSDFSSNEDDIAEKEEEEMNTSEEEAENLRRELLRLPPLSRLGAPNEKSKVVLPKDTKHTNNNSKSALNPKGNNINKPSSSNAFIKKDKPVQEMSRKEREAMEKAAAHQRFLAFKAKEDAARLAQIKKKRDEDAAKHAAEVQAREDAKMKKATERRQF